MMNDINNIKGINADPKAPGNAHAQGLDYTKGLDGETSIPSLLTDDSDAHSGESTVYKYRDFSHVSKDDDAKLAAENPPSNTAVKGSSESSIRVQKFPVKLYVILAQKEFNDIISWMPHGRSWKVHKPSLFESMVMPLFFEYSNYHSFNRLVNAWSFRRMSSGPDRGSYYHEMFLRGIPHLHKYMRRLPKTHKKLPMSKRDEPDFYALDKAKPLPALEDAPVPANFTPTTTMEATQQQLQGDASATMALVAPGSSHMVSASNGLPTQCAQQMMARYVDEYFEPSSVHSQVLPSMNAALHPSAGPGGVPSMQQNMVTGGNVGSLSNYVGGQSQLRTAGGVQIPQQFAMDPLLQQPQHGMDQLQGVMMAGGFDGTGMGNHGLYQGYQNSPLNTTGMASAFDAGSSLGTNARGMMSQQLTMDDQMLMRHRGLSLS